MTEVKRKRIPVEHEFSILGFFQAHPTLVFTCIYLIICTLSVIYTNWFMSYFQINIFDYLEISDFLLLFFRFNDVSSLMYGFFQNIDFFIYTFIFALAIYPFRNYLKEKHDKLKVYRYFNLYLYFFLVIIYWLITEKNIIFNSAKIAYFESLFNPYSASIYKVYKFTQLLEFYMVPAFCIFGTTLTMSYFHFLKVSHLKCKLDFKIKKRKIDQETFKYRTKLLSEKQKKSATVAGISLLILSLTGYICFDLYKYRTNINSFDRYIANERDYKRAYEYGLKDTHLVSSIIRYSNVSVKKEWDKINKKKNFVEINSNLKNSEQKPDWVGTKLKLLMSTSKYVFAYDYQKRRSYVIPSSVISSVVYHNVGSKAVSNHK